MLICIKKELLIIINEGFVVNRRLIFFIFPMPPSAKILELVFQDETLWASIFTGVLYSKVGYTRFPNHAKAFPIRDRQTLCSVGP